VGASVLFLLTLLLAVVLVLVDGLCLCAGVFFGHASCVLFRPGCAKVSEGDTVLSTVCYLPYAT